MEETKEITKDGGRVGRNPHDAHMWWRHMATALAAAGLYVGESYAERILPVMSDDLLLVFSITCFSGAFLCLYRQQIFGLLGFGVAATRPTGVNIVRPLIGLGLSIVTVALVAGLIVNSASLVWVHPTLSSEEEDRARWECEMAAMEKTPKGTNALYFVEPYTETCLKLKGFIRSR